VKKILVMGALAAIAACGSTQQAHKATPTPKSTPCATEDSQGPCYWDAQHRGNGRGKSFRVKRDGKVEYLVAWHVNDQGKEIWVCGFSEQDVLSLDEAHYNDPSRAPEHDKDCNEG
jgi:hypothetical protein